MRFFNSSSSPRSRVNSGRGKRGQCELALEHSTYSGQMQSTLPAAARRLDGQHYAALRPNAFGPAQGGGCLPSGGVLARIARVDGKVREEVQAAAQRAQCRVMRSEWRKEPLEDVSLFHIDGEFFQQCLQVLLGRLLCMEADLIVKGLATPREQSGDPVVVFGLAHPFARGSFHRGACLWSRSWCGPSRRPQAAI